MVKYGYDALNRLPSVTEADGKTIGYKYDKAGRPIRMDYPNGLSELYTYDKAGRLLEVKQAGADGEKLLNSYAYDPAGNIISDISPDFEGKVKAENAISAYNSLNQLTSKIVRDEFNNVTNVFEYTYDKRGNLIKETDIANGNAVKTYLYDETNRMVKGVNADGEESVYTYNGIGVLVSHAALTNKNGAVVTDYAVDYTSPVQSILMAYGSDGMDYRNVYGTAFNKISITVTNAQAGTASKLYIQNDSLGSGRQATDKTSCLGQMGKPA